MITSTKRVRTIFACALAAALCLPAATPALAERATDTNDPVAIAQATQFKTMTATQFLDNISGGQYSTDLKNMESD